MNGKTYQKQNGVLVDITPRVAALGGSGGKTYSGVAPIVVNNTSDTVSIVPGSKSVKGAVQAGMNIDADTNGVLSVKPWGDYEASHTLVDVNDLQDGAIVVTDEPINSDTLAVIAEVEQTLSGQAAMVPSSAAVKTAFDSIAATQGLKNVYLSPAGNDANDGKTAATAVATFAQAMKLAREQSYLATDVLQKQTIVVAAGSYTEDVTVDGLEQKAKYKFYLDGAVSITGNVLITNSGAAEFANGSLSVTGTFHTRACSFCFVSSNLTTGGDVDAESSSSLEFENCGTLTFGGHVYSSGGSSIYFRSYDTVTVAVTVVAIRNGYILIQPAEDKASTFTVSSYIGANYFDGHVLIAGGKSTTDSIVSCLALWAVRNSSLQVSFNGTLRIENTTTNTPIVSQLNSSIVIDKGPVEISCALDPSVDGIIHALENSMIFINVNISITATAAPQFATLICKQCSFVYIGKSMTGTVAGSKPKYLAQYGGQIQFQNSTVSGSIPGGAAGSADAATFATAAVYAR